MKNYHFAYHASFIPSFRKAHYRFEHVAAVYRHQAELQNVNLKVEIENDLSNALRYTPEGGEILLFAKQAEGSLIVSVQDNGSGIPAEILPYAFERSYRGDESRSGKESGLGLAIVKSIVELHGGSIRAKSDEIGSSFSITLIC